MSKANRLSITNRATQKDALSTTEELHVHDELNALLKTASSLVYTVHSAIYPDAAEAGETLGLAASECLYRAWEKLEQAVEKVGRLNEARMWRVKSESEKANA